MTPTGTTKPVDAESPRPLIPSWIISLVLHGSLLFLFATGLRSCGDGSMITADSDFREVGIYVKPAETVSESTEESEATETAETSAALPDQPQLVEAPPEHALELPAPELETIGPGAIAPVSPSLPSDTVVQPSAIAEPARPTGRGPGDISFFGIQSKGSRLVYVIDCSGSMSGYNAINVAKSQLIASLAALEDSQKFQIIFYNSQPRAMKLDDVPANDLYRATDINRTLAARYIAGVDPNLGTDHMPALKLALGLDPDNVFLLTDADVPILRAGDLAKIRRDNGGKAKIHCIEFGRGAELQTESGSENFLQRLARQNGGTYRYHNVRLDNQR